MGPFDGHTYYVGAVQGTIVGTIMESSCTGSRELYEMGRAAREALWQRYRYNREYLAMPALDRPFRSQSPAGKRARAVAGRSAGVRRWA